MQKVCKHQEDQTLETHKFSDRELLDQLQILVDTTLLSVETERKFFTNYEEYDRHRFYRFKKIHESFWRIANQITTKVDRDESPLNTYEEDMRAFLEAHTDRLKQKALEKMELQLGSPENWGK